MGIRILDHQQSALIFVLNVRLHNRLVSAKVHVVFFSGIQRLPVVEIIGSVLLTVMAQRVGRLLLQTKRLNRIPDGFSPTLASMVP